MFKHKSSVILSSVQGQASQSNVIKIHANFHAGYHFSVGPFLYQNDSSLYMLIGIQTNVDAYNSGKNAIK